MSPRTFFTNRIFRQCPVWNKELLYVGGFLARAAYELEMEDIRICWDTSVTSKPGEPLNSELQKWFYDKAGHNLQFFTFRESTPSAVVSSEMRSAFFNCAGRGLPFPVISSAGVRSAFDVRIPDPRLSAFLRKLPIFPEELLDGSKLMIAALRDEGMLRDIAFEDVLGELRVRSLSEEEMVACLQWWINASEQDPTGLIDNRRQFLSAARLTISSPDDGHEQIIPLKGIKTFLNNVFLPTDGPLPSHLLPMHVGQKFDSAQLQRSLQWRELTVLEWVQHIVDPAVYTRKSEFNIVESPVWAECVLQVLSRSWPTLSQANITSIIGLLSKLACIPTSTGMEMPGKAYFSSADIIQDLPIVKFSSGVRVEGNLQILLTGLGVRKYIDLKMIYKRWVPIPQLCSLLTKPL